jgi:hypothetical protein
LNKPISACEIDYAVKQLKNSKAGGLDNILNEHIKSSLPFMKDIYVKLFNVVFNTGIIPESWTIGVIHPIFKNKGAPSDPSNYRPITLLSCLGKLFTSILNLRLQKFTLNNDAINQFQAGFRKHFSTIDNMFVLSCLIDYLKSCKKTLFCAFVDLKAAFDTVWRNGLWTKLISHNIKGNFLNVVRNMYENAKSCVSANGIQSEFFICNIGVRQGENLSPLLFSLYLNDLHDFFNSNGTVSGITCSKHEFDNSVLTFVKLFVLLYADDTVIVAESAEDLQNALNVYRDYCDLWKLTVNISKTKVLVFSKGRQRNYQFVYKNDKLDVVNEYKYLGILFSRSGSFYNAKREIAQQATKAMYSLLKKARALCIPVDMQIDLFMKTVKPILLYGCEIWGYGNLDVIERVQLKFLKLVLKVKSCTPNCVIYGETGVKPLSIDIKTRIISFWANLVIPTTNKLSCTFYSLLLSQYKHTNTAQGNRFQWLSNVQNILIDCGLIDIWTKHEFANSKWLKATVQQKLTDLFLNEWFSMIENSSKCRNYKLFKHKFEPEKYLINTPQKYLHYIVKFRTRNHRLPIEIGTRNRIPLNQRICPKCNNGIGDEYHYLLECSFLLDSRKKYLKNKYYRRPNILHFEEIMNNNINKKAEYRKICEFIKEIICLF